MGGSDTSFSSNISQALVSARIGAEKEYVHLSAKKEDILKNKNLSEQGKRIELAKVAQAEIKVQERLINVLNASIAQYEKLPSAIKAAMISSRQITATDYRNENFVGSSFDAVASFEEVSKSISEAQTSTFQRYSQDMKQLNETMQALDQQMQQNVVAINNMSSNLKDKNGNALLGNIMGANGKIDEKQLQANQKIVFGFDKAMQLMITKAARTRQVARLQEVNMESRNFADAMHKEEGNMDWEKWQKMGAQKQQDYLSGLMKNLDAQISSANESLGLIEKESGKGSDEYKAAAAALKELKAMRKKMGEREAGDIGESDFKMNSGGFMDQHKKLWQLIRKSGQAANTAAARKAFDTKQGQEFLRKNNMTKEQRMAELRAGWLAG